MAFFEYTSPRQLWEKTARELVELNRELYADTVFNFFVSAHHIRDYVEKSNSVPKHELDTFMSDQDLKD
jgi:hypothetical protein